MKKEMILALLLIVPMGCGKGSATNEQKADGKPTLAAVNYPLAYFAERIGGDAADVKFPAPAGDPAYWTPNAEAVRIYQQADRILLNGAGYATWTQNVSLPASRCVDTSKAFADTLIHLKEDLTHSHGPAGKHAHGKTAFTTWLDFAQAAEQAQAVHDAIASRPGMDSAALAEGLAALKSDLADLDVAMQDVARKIGQRPMVASHPVYPYWSARYSLNTKSVHWEPDEAPTQAQWKELHSLLRDHPANVMIWEGEPLPATVAKLKAMGLDSVVFDPCGNRPSQGDFVAVMKANVRRLKEWAAK